MNVYAILLPIDPSPVVGVIMSKFPDHHLRITSTQWLVASSSTTQEVSAHLGIYDAANPSGARVGDGIVVAVSNYFGYAPKNVWEWLRSKTETVRG